MSKREQGTWTRTALLEIARAVEPCLRLRQSYASGPCIKSDYVKREDWCRECVAWAALKELNQMLKKAVSK